MTKFSIIIPVYNVEKFLPECLDSVAYQSLSDIEIICIDDGSIDSSSKILEQYAKNDKRLTILKQKNQGQGVARNNGLEIAKGDYILFVDPDDWIEADTLKILYKKFLETNAEVIQFDYKKINDLSKSEKLYKFSKEVKKRKYKINLEKTPYFNWSSVKNHALNGMRLMLWNKAYSLNFLRKNNIKCAPNKHSEDHIFSIKTLISAEKIYYLNIPLYNYRLREGSAVNIKTDENFCIFDNIQYIDDFLKSKNLKTELDKEFKSYKVNYLCWHFDRINDSSRTKYLEMCRNILSKEDYKRLIRKIKNGNKSFVENMFSIKNRIENARKYKIITFLGREIKYLPAKEKPEPPPAISRPFVSIILTAYNAERTIRQCLAALIAQTYSNIEIICVNDGSTDKTPDIINNFAQQDSRLKVFNNSNQGTAKSRYFALNQASGEFIMFCDADDRYEKDMVETMVSAVVENNVDIAMCDCNIIDLSNGKLQNRATNEYHHLQLKGYQKISPETINKINVVVWNKIFRKSLLKKYNIEYPEKYEHDDCIFVYKYLAFARTFFGINKKLYNYVVGNPDSMMGKLFTGKNRESKYDFILCRYNLYDFLETHETQLKGTLIEISRCQIRIFYAMLNKSDKQKAFLLIKEMIEKYPMLLENKEFQKIRKTVTPEEFEKIFFKQKVSPVEQIFSIKNNLYKTHKVLRILGIKINIKRKPEKTAVKSGENNG